MASRAGEEARFVRAELDDMAGDCEAATPVNGGLMADEQTSCRVLTASGGRLSEDGGELRALPRRHDLGGWRNVVLGSMAAVSVILVLALYHSHEAPTAASHAASGGVVSYTAVAGQTEGVPKGVGEMSAEDLKSNIAGMQNRLAQLESRLLTDPAEHTKSAPPANLPLPHQLPDVVKQAQLPLLDNQMRCGNLTCAALSVCCNGICGMPHSSCCSGKILCEPGATCCNGICCAPNAVCCNGACGAPGSSCTGAVPLAPAPPPASIYG